MSPYVLGLDIGGTKLAVGLVDEEGRVGELVIEPTLTHLGPQQALGRLLGIGQRVLDASSDRSPIAVGISCGGPLDSVSGMLVNPPHLPGWFDVPVVELARSAFARPAFLANDASAAALGEFHYGAGVEAQSLVYLTLSTGVGGGMVVDGRLHAGAAGNGGEFGHITVRPGGRPCTCGRLGCLESYCSGTSIALRAREFARRADRDGVQTTLHDSESLTAADVTRAVSEGDGVASAVWDETVEILGQAVTDLVNILEPEVVVLGGGVTRAGALLLDPVQRRVKETAMGPARKAVRVELAGLGEAVGVVGAAAVAMNGMGQ